MKKQLRLGVDVDMVLRDMISKITELLKRDNPSLLLMDKPDRYNFNNIDLSLKDKIKLWENIYSKEIFLEADPMPGAIEQFFKLEKWAAKNNVKLVCVTLQTRKNAHYTFQWLHKHKIYFSEYHITHQKYLTGVDYIIDDSPDNYHDWTLHGLPEDHFIIFDCDHNRHVKVTNRVNSLMEAVKIVEKKVSV